MAPADHPVGYPDGVGVTGGIGNMFPEPSGTYATASVVDDSDTSDEEDGTIYLADDNADPDMSSWSADDIQEY